MTQLPDLTARIRVDTSDLDRASGKADGFGKKLSGGLAGAAAVAGAAIVAFGASSVRAASDLEQSFGAVDSVFGKSAGTVRKFAEGAADSVGLAKSEYQSLAAVVGSQLQRLGQSQDESAQSTDRLLRLSADLAATYGGPVSDAVEAVGSLLRGERDPIERYAVGIKDVDVQARLAATGQDKLKGASLEQAKAQATLALLFDQTKNAQGAFGRESNTLAGTQERLRAQFKNVQAEVGTALLPILTSLGQKLLVLIQQFKDGTGTGGDLKEAFNKIKASIEANMPTIKAVAAALLEVGTFIATKVAPPALVLSQGPLRLLIEGFRLLITVSGQVGVAVLGMVSTFLSGLQSVFNVLAKVPGPFQSSFQAASVAVGVAKRSVEGLAVAVDVATRPKTLNVAANTARAKSDIDSVGAAAERLRDKTITITTIERRVIESEAARDANRGRNGVGQRAGGGPVTAGRTYLVGEREPELFVPRVSGQILNQRQIAAAAGGGATYNVTINRYGGSGDGRDVVGALQRWELLSA